MCLWKVFVKGFSAEGFRKDSGRIPEGSRPLALPLSIRKVFAEGSVEDFCGRFCGRFLRKVPRKVLGRFFAEGKKYDFEHNYSKIIT